MEKSKIRPFGWRDKLGYAMGDMGCGFSFQLVSTFMQLFYLQYIGIKATDYAAIILISKIFDAQIYKEKRVEIWVLINSYKYKMIYIYYNVSEFNVCIDF